MQRVVDLPWPDTLFSTPDDRPPKEIERVTTSQIRVPGAWHSFLVRHGRALGRSSLSAQRIERRRPLTPGR